MNRIIELSEIPELLENAVEYFWNCWGNENNFKFYRDCIIHSTDKNKKLPKFFVIVQEKQIIASYALLTNDIISRQDLYPWLACLHVNEEHRNKGIASQLLIHGVNETANMGYPFLYLSSDLENFYEKRGWKHCANGFNTFDGEIKIYTKQCIFP